MGSHCSHWIGLDDRMETHFSAGCTTVLFSMGIGKHAKLRNWQSVNINKCVECTVRFVDGCYTAESARVFMCVKHNENKSLTVFFSHFGCSLFECTKTPRADNSEERIDTHTHTRKKGRKNFNFNICCSLVPFFFIHFTSQRVI